MRRSARWDPMKPAPPVIKVRMSLRSVIVWAESLESRLASTKFEVRSKFNLESCGEVGLFARHERGHVPGFILQRSAQQQAMMKRRFTAHAVVVQLAPAGKKVSTHR